MTDLAAHGANDVTVRALSAGDEDSVVRLCNAAVSWSPDTVREEMTAESRQWLVAEADSHVIGVIEAATATDMWDIMVVSVDPKWRRQGIGRQLVDAVQVIALASDATLQLEVNENNREALALYNAVGFSEVGRRRRYYADGADALLLDLLESDVAASQPANEDKA